MDTRKKLHSHDAARNICPELLQAVREMMTGHRGGTHKVKVPNAATRKAIEQLEKGKGKRSASARALFKTLRI